MKFHLSVLAVLFLGLSACAQVQPTPLETSPAAATVESTAAPVLPSPTAEALSTHLPARVPTATPPSAAAEPKIPAGSALAALVERAMADLAGRLGVDPGDLTLVSADEVVWNDGSLGCPEPGMMYTQALVDGYQIVLSYQDQTYDYHANRERVFLCERKLPVPRTTLQPAAGLKLIQAAMADLSQRLGLTMQEIQPEPLVPMTWPDASLGCPQPGEVYVQAETSGYEIRLKVGDETYTYHANQNDVVFCD